MNRQKIIAALQKLGIEFDANASVEVLNSLLRGSWLTVRNSTDSDYSAGDNYEFEMTINGQIGVDWYGDGYSASQFQDELKPFKGKAGLLQIHSGGGNVWDAFAIAEMVRNHGSIDTKILGLAASSGDVIFQAGKNRIMPAMAMRMAHNASGGIYLEGNATELTSQKGEVDKLITRLEKHNNTLASMYAKRTGNALDAIKEMMDAEEFMDGDESLEKGFCDRLTDEVPVTNSLDLSHLRKVPQSILNSISAPPQGAAKPTKNQSIIMNRKQMEALLNEWGVKFDTGMTDEQIVNLVKAGKPAPATIAPATSTATAPQNAAPAPAPAPVMNIEDHPVIKAARQMQETARRDTLRNRITQLASEDRIPANQIEEWVNDAFAAADDPVKGNPVINRLAQLEPKAPGVQNIRVELGEENLTISRLDQVVTNLSKPAQSIRGDSAPRDEVRKAIAQSSKQISSLINRMKKFDASGTLVGPLRDAFDARAAGVQNANSMSANLLRQVILSEIMRAFRREFATLSLFSHNYKDVALQGTDKVEVPYYPLDTTASTEFNGTYTVTPNATTSAKEIVVGGTSAGTATSGSGRKYKALGFSAYEIARQPWLNIAQLVVMAAEQLAIDVRADILGTHIKAANFGNAIWTGASGAFDKSVFTNYLLNAAIKAYWPMSQRNCVLTPDFFTNLIGDPGLQRANEAASDESLRNGIISRLLSFGSVGYDALLPVANFIRGGDGTVTAGSDTNLAGFIAYPSAILIATAPIMPGPATMRLLASYEQVTDEQTGLTFSYQYFGNILGSQDAEIIECSYGSGLGELAALRRITTSGN